jgi:hypothetical protein
MSPEHAGDVQPLALGDRAILRELSRRVVEHGDARAGGGEDGSLLAARDRRGRAPVHPRAAGTTPAAPASRA